MWGEIGFKKYPFNVKALREGIERGYEASRRTKDLKKETFAPSNINTKYYGNCPAYWGQVLSEETPQYDTTKAHNFAVMKNGSKFHERMEEVLQESGLEVLSEEEFKMENPGIRGFIDVIVTIDDEQIVGELKSARSESFTVKKASMKANEEHLIQLLIYLKAKKLTKGFILYENKNDQECLIIPVEMTPENEEFIESVFEWLRGIEERVANKEKITRPWSKPISVCQKCPIMNACWSNEEIDGKWNYPTLKKHLKK